MKRTPRLIAGGGSSRKKVKLSQKEEPKTKKVPTEKKIKRYLYDGKVVKSEVEARARDGYTIPLPTRNSDQVLIFDDALDFMPNMTPEEILRAGSFGGTYFRPIKSSVTGMEYDKMWLELPQNWIDGLNVGKFISSSVYNKEINTYKVKCGGDLEMWETSGWITSHDPYGWFQWYCRYYIGRRTNDDLRQIKRWKNCTGPKGRWKGNLVGKIFRADKKFDDVTVSPVVRQVLQHWGYRLTEKDFNLSISDKRKKA